MSGMNTEKRSSILTKLSQCRQGREHWALVHKVAANGENLCTPVNTNLALAQTSTVSAYNETVGVEAFV